MVENNIVILNFDKQIAKKCCQFKTKKNLFNGIIFCALHLVAFQNVTDHIEIVLVNKKVYFFGEQ